MKIIACTVVLLTFVSFQVIGQSSLEFGVGCAYHLQYFQHQNPDKFDNELLKPDFGHALGIHSYLDFDANSNFTIRANVTLGQKKIALSNKFNLNQQTGTVKLSIIHQLFYCDFSLLAMYDLPKSNFTPLLGFFGSFNQYTNFTQRTRLRGNGVLSGQGFPTMVLDVEEEPFIFYAGIHLGVSYTITWFQKELEVCALLYYSPADLFDADFVYEENYEEKSIRGKFHYLSLGINIPLKNG